MISETYNMDCMEYMSGLPDNYADLAIVDPPYGIKRDNQNLTLCKNPKHNRKQHLVKEWDNEPPSKQYFNELYRVTKNQIIWGANYFVHQLSKPSMAWIVWDKGQYGLTMSDCELAFSSYDKPTRIWLRNRFVLQQEGVTIHPTQKPVALYKWLLQNYAKEGDKILDTHLGSGSSRIACYDLGFDFVGCELDKDYFEAQEKRFANHIQQPSLLEPEKRVEVQGSMFA